MDADPSAMAARVDALLAEFRAADARMRDLPIHNPALTVEAVGFRPWEDTWAGVVITPWFMNVVLLARDPAAWADRYPGNKSTWQLPAGPCEFIFGVGEACGPYQSCSLYSPMGQFGDPDTARQVAEEALRLLFEPPAEDADAAPDGPQMSRRAFLAGGGRDRSHHG